MPSPEAAAPKEPGVPTPPLSRGYPAVQTTVSTRSSPEYLPPSKDGLSPLPWRLRLEGVQAPVNSFRTPLLDFFFFFCRVLRFVGLGTTLACTWSCAVGPRQWGPEKHYCLPASPRTVVLLQARLY